MNVTIKPSERWFRHHSVYDLISLIVHDSSVEAKEELVCYRKLFLFEGQGYVLLPDYLVAMWRDRAEKVRRGPTLLWDLARDMTLDKFTALPGIDGEDVLQKASDEETDSVSKADCRLYYDALLNGLESNEEFRVASGTLAQDHVVAVQFQKLVNYHFHMSYLEALRKRNPFVSRYNWCLDGRGTITVFMPKYLKQRRAWLDKHVDNPDPDRLGERERIQNIINEKLAIPRFVPIDTQREVGRCSGFPAPDVEADRKMRPSFVAFLAREKALSADLQRPGIQKLGFEKIERLVHIAVPNLVTHERTDRDIANEFGLTPTVASHFFGSQWYKNKKTKRIVIPDLWRNAAELLRQVEAFRDIAAQAGVLKAAMNVAGQDGPARLRRPRYVP